MKITSRNLLLSLSGLLCATTWAAADPGYKKPPEAIDKVLRAPLPPITLFNPTRDTIMLATPVRYPPVADLAQPMLRLAGVRVLTKNRGLHAGSYCSSLDLVKVADGTTLHVALPKGAKPGYPRWSPDGKQYAFTMTTPTSIELYLGRADSPAVRKVPGVQLNPFFPGVVEWMPDRKTLLVRQVPASQGPPPGGNEAPTGPDVSETSGAKGASSTYEVRDVLKGLHDEALFDYYGRTQLTLVDSATGKLHNLGRPDLYSEASPSPDGQHLLVETVHRPYSYLTTYDRFPKEVDVWDNAGNVLRHIASLPAADHVPIWGSPTGPRDFEWRSTAPASLVWREALDGGDFKTKAPFRDRVMTWTAPFQGTPREVLKTVQRCSDLAWLEKFGQVVITDDDPVKHWTRKVLVDFDSAQPAARLLWERSTDDGYGNPGNPVYRRLPSGEVVLEQEGDWIFLSGAGASSQGDRPFLDKFNLQTLKSERLFRSDKDCYESFVAWTDRSKGLFLTRYESPTQPPNIFVRTLGDKVEGAPAEPIWASARGRAVTHLGDPTPEIRGITKKLITYKRADGVDLSFNLYLPPNYKAGTRLPAVVWAYPLDYADAKMAGQVTGSTQRFTTLGWPLHLFCLLDGYAVIDNPSMPVVGDTNKIYDTYMEQLIAGAQAAVDKAVELGVVDRDRIGVTGHSHGGLMTANLLAHTDLFRAGVARSGAYNRSLTAFGFQNERRTLWEAPEVYFKVSAFFHADKIKLPLLLIHGAADANPGTVPLQSQILFEAIRGTGGTARLVMLPYESHGYTSLESNQQVIYEMLTWFDRFVKNAPPKVPKKV